MYESLVIRRSLKVFTKLKGYCEALAISCPFSLIEKRNSSSSASVDSVKLLLSTVVKMLYRQSMVQRNGLPQNSL